MSFGQAALVALAGFLAGAINAIIGSGSLITFPTLLAVGLPPVTANVTNTVGLVLGHLVSSAVNAGQDHGRVGQQDRAGAPEDLGVGDAQEPAEVLIFGFVEGEQTITLRLKDRRIGG